MVGGESVTKFKFKFKFARGLAPPFSSSSLFHSRFVCIFTYPCVSRGRISFVVICVE